MYFWKIGIKIDPLWIISISKIDQYCPNIHCDVSTAPLLMKKIFFLFQDFPAAKAMFQRSLGARAKFRISEFRFWRFHSTTDERMTRHFCGSSIRSQKDWTNSKKTSIDASSKDFSKMKKTFMLRWPEVAPSKTPLRFVSFWHFNDFNPFS